MAFVNPLLAAMQGNQSSGVDPNDTSAMNQDIAQGQQNEDHIGSMLTQAAQARMAAIASGKKAPNEDMAPFAYDPQSQTFYAMGRPLDKSFTLYQGALNNADKLAPFSAPPGTIPMSKDAFASAVNFMDQNRSLPKTALVGHAVANAFRAAVGGGIGMVGALLNQSADQEGATGQGMDADADHAFAGKLAGWQKDISDVSDKADQDFQGNLTPEQQAAMQTTYGQHPVTALARDVLQVGGGAIPGVAAFAVNPALGIAAFTGQGAQGGHDLALANISQTLAQVPDAVLQSQNQDYAAMRAQGIPEDAAKAQLAEHGAQTAEIVGGVAGGATAPFMGRLGMGALSRAASLTGSAIPTKIAGNFAARALMLGGENATLQEGQSDIAQAAGAASAGPGAGSLNPLQYFNPESAGAAGAFGAVLGVFHNAPKTQARGDQPTAPIANSDIGAATTAAAPTQQPLPMAQPPQPAAPMYRGVQGPAQGDLFANQPLPTRPPAPVPNPGQGDLFAQAPPQGAPPQQMEMPLPQGQAPQGPMIQNLAAQRTAPPPEAPPGPPQALPGPTAGGLTQGQGEQLAQLQQHFDYVQQMLTSRWKSEKAADKTTTGKMLLQERQGLAQAIEQLRQQQPAQGQLFPQSPAPGEPVAAPQDRMPDGRPAGVAPPPLPNPEPMSPAEAASRADTQAERGQAAPPAPEQGQLPLPEPPAPAPVTPTTPEPASDIQAQVASMLDKTTSKDAVFVAHGNEAAIPENLPKKVVAVTRPEGTLLTTNKAKAAMYRSMPLNDESIGKLLGYPEPKAAAIQGPAPTVVEGRDADGNVTSQMLADQDNAPAAVQTAADQTPAGGTVETKPAVVAQAQRAAKARAEEASVRAGATKGAAAIERAKGAQASRPKGSAPLGALNELPEPEALQRQAAETETPRDREALEKQAAQAQAAIADRTTAAENAKREALGAPPLSEADTGRPTDMLLSKAPLDAGEMRTLGEHLKDQAQYEAQDPDWSPRNSVIRRMLPDLGLAGGDERAIIKELADADPAQIRELLTSAKDNVSNSTLAKQIVRGRDEVAQATRAGEPSPINDSGNVLHAADTETAEQETKPSFDLPEKPSASGRVVTYGDAVSPRDVAIVDHWVKLMESQSGKILPDKIEMYDKADFLKRFGDNPYARAAVKNSTRGLSGRVKDAGGNSHNIIMVDRSNLTPTARMEVLAHEFGHMIDNHIFQRLTPDDQAEVRAEFERWREVNGKGTPNEAMLSRMPPVMAEQLRAAGGNSSSMEYATSFNEWMADGVARWLLTDQKPLNAVDRFFSLAAQAIKQFYNTLIREKTIPPQSIEQFLNDWVSSAHDASNDGALSPLHAMDIAAGDEPHEEPSGDLNGKVRAAAAGLKTAAKPVVETGKRIGSIAAAFGTGNIKEGVGLGKSFLSDVHEGAVGQMLEKGVLGVSNLRDVVRRYGDSLPGLRQWHDALLGQQNDAKRAMEGVSRAMEKAMQLGPDAQKLLQRVMYESTINDVHPDVPFDDTLNKHLQSNDPELQASNEAKHGRVSAIYDQLKQAGGDNAYKALRDSYKQLHDDTLDNIRRNIENNTQLSDKAKEDALARIDQQVATARRGPYFPLMRDGNWVTTAHVPAEPISENGSNVYATRQEADEAFKRYKANNPHAQASIEKTEDGYTLHAIEKAVYFHPTLADAKAARPSIEAELRNAFKSRGVDYDEAQNALGKDIIDAPYEKLKFYDELKNVPSAFMDRINTLAKNGEIDPMVHQLMSEMYIESMPELSYRKSALTRENIRGASQDMLRAYARRATGAAHHYAVSNHASDISNAWNTMIKARGDLAKEHPEIGGVLNNLHARQELLAKRTQSSPLNTAVNVLQDASMFMSLGLQPAFLLVQGVQPALAGLPVLAGLSGKDGKGIGLAKAQRYIREAYDGTGGYFGKRGAQQFGMEFKKLIGSRADYPTMSETMKEVFDKFGQTPDEKATLQHLADRGSLDFSFMNALHDATNSATRNKWNALLRMSMAFTQQVEAMNRVTIGLAAHRLGIGELGLEEGSPELRRFVDDTVTKTQGDYSRLNAPSVMNRPLPGLALQFKKYTQFMYSLFASNMAKALTGKTPEEKREGLRTLGYLMASHASLSGATGLGPIYGAAKMTAAMAAWGAQAAGLEDKKDKWKSIDTLSHEMYKKLGEEVFGKGAGDMTAAVLEHGLPALAGVDISDRVGLPMLYDSRFAGTKPQDSGGSTLDKMLSYAMGTSWYNAKRVANGVGQLTQGNYKQAASTMLPGGARALMQAYMMADHGVTDSHGGQVVPQEGISLFDVAQQAMGLRPASLNRAYDERDEVTDTSNEIKASRQQLIDKYRQADEDERDKLHERIAAYNATVPSAMRITGAQLANAVKTSGRPSKAEMQIQRLNEE